MKWLGFFFFFFLMLLARFCKLSWNFLPVRWSTFITSSAPGRWFDRWFNLKIGTCQAYGVAKTIPWPHLCLSNLLGVAHLLSAIFIIACPLNENHFTWQEGWSQSCGVVVVVVVVFNVFVKKKSMSASAPIYFLFLSHPRSSEVCPLTLTRCFSH